MREGWHFRLAVIVLLFASLCPGRASREPAPCPPDQAALSSVCLCCGCGGASECCYRPSAPEEPSGKQPALPALPPFAALPADSSVTAVPPPHDAPRATPPPAGEPESARPPPYLRHLRLLI